MAEASPIRHHRIGSERAPKLPAWHAYLQGGPELWARAQSPEIGTEIHQMMNHALKSADPMANLNVQYLMWRRSLNSARFDHYHPRVGRELQSMLTPTSVYPVTDPGSTLAPQQIDPPTSTPATPSSSTSASTIPPPPSTAPDTLTPSDGTSPAPSAIPEPETVTIALVLVSSALWWRSRGSGVLAA